MISQYVSPSAVSILLCSCLKSSLIRSSHEEDLAFGSEYLVADTYLHARRLKPAGYSEKNMHIPSQTGDIFYIWGLVPFSLEKSVYTFREKTCSAVHFSGVVYADFWATNYHFCGAPRSHSEKCS